MKAKKLCLSLFVWMMAIGLSTTVVSCKDDDDEPAIGSNGQLVGEWSVLKSEGYYKYFDTGEKEITDEVYSEGEAIWSFEANGTTKNVLDGQYGTWSYKGNKLVCNWIDGKDSYTEEWTVLELNDNTLVMENYEEDEEGVYYVKITCKKIATGNDDDNTEAFSVKKLLGKWLVIREEGYEYVNGKREPFDDEYSAEKAETLIFNEDGTVGGTMMADDFGSTKGLTWSFATNKITMKMSGEKENLELKVLELTDSKLVMEYYEGSEFYMKITCKR